MSTQAEDNQVVITENGPLPEDPSELLCTTTNNLCQKDTVLVPANAKVTVRITFPATKMGRKLATNGPNGNTKKATDGFFVWHW